MAININIESIKQIFIRIWNDPVLASVIGGIILLIGIGINKRIRKLFLIMMQRIGKKKTTKVKVFKTKTDQNYSELIKRKIYEYNHPRYDLKQTEKYLNDNKIETILRTPDNKKEHDIIVLVHTMLSRLDMTEIRNFYNSKRNYLINKYKKDFNRNCRIVLFIIYNKNNSQNEELNRFIKENKAFSKSIPLGQFWYYLVQSDEIDNFNIERIFKITDREVF